MKVRANASASATWTSGLQDCALLAFAVALISALYVPRLGFYSDDWSFLRTFTLSDDQSLSGLVQSFFAEDTNTRARPVQALYLAVLYQLFGLNPVGHHVANTLVFLAGLCAFYFAAHRLTEDRMFSLAVVLVYSALPHYSTDRFWYAAFQANLSMALYFFSLYCCLRQLTAVGAMYAAWSAGAILSMMASVLAYEVFIPFFLLNCLLVAIKQWQLAKSSRAPYPRPVDLLSLYLGPTLLIALAVPIKHSVSSRGRTFEWSMLNDAVSAAFEMTVGAYGANLPHILQTIFRDYLDWPIIAVAVVAATGISYGLMYLAQKRRARLAATSMLAWSTVGSVVFAGLSYAYFFRYSHVNTGIDNRVSNAATVCVALFLVSCLSLLLKLLKQRSVGATFCITIGLVCGCGSLITNTIATFWIAASRAQSEVMEGLKTSWKSPSPGSSIFLHGFCPWIGPGIVFETDWDVTGAVGLAYRDRTLRGNVLRPWMSADEDGLRAGDAFHSFASLYVYDARNRQVRQIIDQGAALRLLQKLVEEDVTGCVGNYKAFGPGLPIW